MLRFFSLALGASLVGLVARTFFVQVGQSVTESSDLVEGEVDALARMVSAKSRKVLGEFEALSAKLGESYLKLGTNLEASAETLQRTMQRFDQAVRSDIDILEREGLRQQQPPSPLQKSWRSKSTSQARSKPRLAQLML
uniref:Uncharacterized protein n=1 Tax=Phenylobacterium glaciei TaxID=2803784 RepID=A0A974P0K6_9CAUL|nr:hypothetical protein JKL49_16605 [Phenylobacterium glaciei]